MTKPRQAPPEAATAPPDTAEGHDPGAIGFRPITPDTPRDRWLLVRWRDHSTRDWRPPMAVRWAYGWTDGLRSYPEATHWSDIPRDAGE